MVTHKFLVCFTLLLSFTTVTIFSMDTTVLVDELASKAQEGEYDDSYVSGVEDDFDNEDSYELEPTPVSKKNALNANQYGASPDAPTQQLTTEEKMRHLVRRSQLNGKAAEKESGAKNKALGALFRHIRIELVDDNCIKKMHELIEQGLNPDLADDDGRTALYHATMRDRVRIMEYLIDICCVDVRRTFEGKTYLDLAIDRDNVDAARCLYRHIPLHIANGVGGGELPLVNAIRLKRWAIVDVLLTPDSSFANFGQPCDRVSAYQLAVAGGDKQLASYLKAINEQTRRFEKERSDRRLLEVKQKTHARKGQSVQEKFERESSKSLVIESDAKHGSSFLPRLLGAATLGIIGFIAYKVGQESRTVPSEIEFLKAFYRL